MRRDATNCFSLNGPVSAGSETSADLRPGLHPWQPLTLFVEATRVLSTAAPVPTGGPSTPTCPDTSLPWSDDCSLGGWSAKMYLHQLLATSTPRWQPSDTERVLLGWTLRRRHAKPASGTTLSDVINPPGTTQTKCFRTAHMVQGLIRRALARGRSLRLLLRTARDTIPVIVTFGSRAGGCESWTATSASALPDFLLNGLLDFLRRHAPGCAGMRCRPRSRNGSDGE